jgi:hypothetical protein
MWLRLAGRSGRPRSSRRSVSLICGGWLPQDLVFVARPLSKIEHRRLTPGCSWGCRGLGVRECRDARAASSAATGCRGGSQAIAGSCFGGMERACVRGSPAGMDAGGTGSGWEPDQVAISQQKQASSRAIATATTPLGFLRASLS